MLLHYVPGLDSEHTPQLWQYLLLLISFVPQFLQNILPSFSPPYGGPQVSHANKKAMTHKQKPRHKRKSHGTKEKATAQKKKPRHKRKSHGTKAKATAQKKKPRHKRKSHGTKEKATAQKKKPQHKRKSHGTKEKVTAHVSATRFF